jgi:2-polyprenyl-6-methoxyphenol hydroxylase-like FAD-dependent oxidoreductase
MVTGSTQRGFQVGRIAFIGGGIVGTCAAMMLANDGHQVTVLERDPTSPPPPDIAWDEWDRRGVNQFKMLHFFLARFRHVADAELPGLTDAMVAAGALRLNPLVGIPDEVTGGWRDDDDRFEAVTARRPVAESVIATLAAATPGVTIRRGVGVSGVLTSTGADGIVHVSGVRTEDGEDVPADLVVDAGGRRSSMPSWLRDAGSVGPEEKIEDCGFLYYGRHFRSADGSVPPAFGGLLQPYGSVSVLTLPADNGTWGVGVITSSKDAALRGLLEVECWEKVVGSYPMVAHWLGGEPITDVKLMAKIEDRQRNYVVDGKPVATGVVALADAWACTNPSLGRGISIGIVHAAALRALLREVPLDEPKDLAMRWNELTMQTVEPHFVDTLAFDRHRLAEIEAVIEGHSYETDDPGWNLSNALANSIMGDPDLLRGFLEVALLLDTGANVLSRPGVAERAIALADSTPLPGPDRAELLSLVGA